MGVFSLPKADRWAVWKAFMDPSLRTNADRRTACYEPAYYQLAVGLGEEIFRVSASNSVQVSHFLDRFRGASTAPATPGVLLLDAVLVSSKGGARSVWCSKTSGLLDSSFGWNRKIAPLHLNRGAWGSRLGDGTWEGALGAEGSALWERVFSVPIERSGADASHAGSESGVPSCAQRVGRPGIVAGWLVLGPCRTVGGWSEEHRGVRVCL